MFTYTSRDLPAPDRNGNKQDHSYTSLAESTPFKEWAGELDDQKRAIFKKAWDDNRPVPTELALYQEWANYQLEGLSSVSEFCDIICTMESADDVIWALYHGGALQSLVTFVRDSLEETARSPSFPNEASDWIRSLPEDHRDALIEIFLPLDLACSASELHVFAAERLRVLEQCCGFYRLVLQAGRIGDIDDMMLRLQPRN